MILLLILCTCTISLGVKLPPGINLCHRSDPNFQQCVAKSIGEALPILAKGNKELGIPQIEPFFIPELEIKGDPSQSITLQQKYKNVRIYGSTIADLTKRFELEVDNGCKWETDVSSPLVRMEADYEIKGQLLVFPINSHGKCNITQYNALNKHTMACEKYTKGNNTYLRVTNYILDMKPEKVVYEFENIFPGSDLLSNEILNTINDNALDIFRDFKGGFEQIFSTMYLNVANNLFSKIPLRDIFLD